MLLLAAVPAAAAEGPAGDLTQIGFEALVNLEVTSLSKRPEKWSQTGAAVYVITREDIRRSGVTSIPEALRLAPGVHVARVDGNKWSIGVRGFGSRLSRSLLVLIDGRTVYSPLFAGVYWEVQDVLLEDIERIEVIRGPGGSLWGANAVNGVVNIITRSAGETQGGLAVGGGGAEEKGFGAFRFGGSRGERFHYRVDAKAFDRDGAFAAGAAEFDEWWMGRASARADWEPRPGSLIGFEAAAYDGRSGQRSGYSVYNPPSKVTVTEDADLSGGHLLGRWRREGEKSSIRSRFYYDRTHRREPTFSEDRDTFDLDVQQHLTGRSRNEIVWGLGYRVTSDDVASVETIEFRPSARSDHLASAFVQDEITLAPGRLRLTIGSKFEHNEYSGFEMQPSTRLVWTPSERHALWGMVSRAVRTPSRIERGLALTALLEPATPTFIRIIGDREFDSETLLAWEIGYRGEPAPGWLLDVALFLNSYRNLLSLEPGTAFVEMTPPPDHTVLPLFIRNGIEGGTYGGEIVAEWRILEWWRLSGAWSYLRIDLDADAGSQDVTTAPSTNGSSPRHQAWLRSSMNLQASWEVEGFLRYVDELPADGVDRYVEMDLGLHWLARPGLRLSLIGRNLLHRHHAESSEGSVPVEAERAAYLKVTGRW
jgi:iron complex outermembrane receptor protein